jgi:hypothetical protein
MVGKVVRGVLVFLISLGTIFTTLLRDYYQAMSYWNLELHSGHFNPIEGNRYSLLVTTAFKYVGICCGLCSIGSAIMLACTIFLVKKVTQE